MESVRIVRRLLASEGRVTLNFAFFLMDETDFVFINIQHRKIYERTKQKVTCDPMSFRIVGLEFIGYLT